MISFSRLSLVCFERAKQHVYVSPNPPDELAQNVSKKSLSTNLPFDSSESYLFFNYLHDMNSIFRVAGINSEKVFGRIARITSLRVVCSYSRSIELQCQSRSYSPTSILVAGAAVALMCRQDTRAFQCQSTDVQWRFRSCNMHFS